MSSIICLAISAVVGFTLAYPVANWVTQVWMRWKYKTIPRTDQEQRIAENIVAVYQWLSTDEYEECQEELKELEEEGQEA